MGPPHLGHGKGQQVRRGDVRLVPSGAKIREISGKNLDLDLDLDLDVDLDSREQAAGSQTGQVQLLASKRMV